MFILQEKPIDITQAKNLLSNSINGALVTFEGIVRVDRRDDKEVGSLLYIANFAECVDEGEKIVKEAIDLHPINNAICIQRIGQVNVGEAAIWIGVWSSHRDAAFKGCRYIIEETKKRLLIWKKENFTNGTSAWIRGKDTPEIT
jgi:molybdopterin synthase catalytic subunit